MFKVTVEIEGDEYVARTNDGIWHTKGKIQESELTGMELAEYLYHSDEIAFTEHDENGETVIYLFGVEEHDIQEEFTHYHNSIRVCIDELESTLAGIANMDEESLDWQRIAKLQELAKSLGLVHPVIEKIKDDQLECEDCHGSGRVTMNSTDTVDKGTKWERSADYFYQDECPTCNGTGKA